MGETPIVLISLFLRYPSTTLRDFTKDPVFAEQSGFVLSIRCSFCGFVCVISSVRITCSKREKRPARDAHAIIADWLLRRGRLLESEKFAQLRNDARMRLN